MSWKVVYLFVWLCCGISGITGSQLVAKTGMSTNAAFLLASGVTAETEQCLVVAAGAVDLDRAAVVLMPCLDAVAAGDGREVWRSQPNGQIVNVVGGKCLILEENSVVEGGRLSVGDCDGAAKSDDGRSQWEVQGNGQLKSRRTGSFCLSQMGQSSGTEDVALHAAVAATSVADVVEHGAARAVDGSSRTFWASGFGESDVPVELVVDLGSE